MQIFSAIVNTLSEAVRVITEKVKTFNSLENLEKAKKDAEKALDAAHKTDSYKKITAAEKALSEAEKALQDAKRNNDSIRLTDCFQLAVFLAVFGAIQYTTAELVKLASDYGLSSIGQFGYFTRVKKLCDKLGIEVIIRFKEKPAEAVKK